MYALLIGVSIPLTEGGETRASHFYSRILRIRWLVRWGRTRAISLTEAGEPQKLLSSTHEFSIFWWLVRWGITRTPHRPRPWSRLHVWMIASVFSILMNFTYLIEAVSLKSFTKIEAIVSILLIIASILGLVISPQLLISAIFGHGVWDLLKHFGRGVPFYFWYTCSCFLVDTAYSLSLLFYYFK